MTDVQTRDNPAEARFEAWTDGALAGRLEYHLSPDRIALTHIELDPEFKGRGIGPALARGAFDQIRARGEHTVIPVCSFVRSWLQRNPDYLDVVAPEAREDTYSLA